MLGSGLRGCTVEAVMARVLGFVLLTLVAAAGSAAGQYDYQWRVGRGTFYGTDS